MFAHVVVRVVAIGSQIVHTFGQEFTCVRSVRLGRGWRCGEVVRCQIACYDLSAQISLINVTIATRAFRYGVHILMLFGVLFGRTVMIVMMVLMVMMMMVAT